MIEARLGRHSSDGTPLEHHCDEVDGTICLSFRRPVWQISLRAVHRTTSTSREKTYFGLTYFEMCRYLFEIGRRGGTEARTIWHSQYQSVAAFNDGCSLVGRRMCGYRVENWWSEIRKNPQSTWRANCGENGVSFASRWSEQVGIVQSIPIGCCIK